MLKAGHRKKRTARAAGCILPTCTFSIISVNLIHFYTLVLLPSFPIRFIIIFFL